MKKIAIGFGLGILFFILIYFLIPKEEIKISDPIIKTSIDTLYVEILGDAIHDVIIDTIYVFPDSSDVIISDSLSIQDSLVSGYVKFKYSSNKKQVYWSYKLNAKNIIITNDIIKFKNVPMKFIRPVMSISVFGSKSNGYIVAGLGLCFKDRLILMVNGTSD